MEMLRASGQPLKQFLLDQRKVAGIGNIYSSEALWRARLDPRRRASRLTGEEAHRLHKSIVDVLYRALECCAARLRIFATRSGGSMGWSAFCVFMDARGRVAGAVASRCGGSSKGVARHFSARDASISAH